MKSLISLLLFFPIFLFSALEKDIGFIMEIKGEIYVYRPLNIKTVNPARLKQVKFDGKDMNEFKALKYEKLYVGDIIQARKSSKAKLIINNKNILFVDEFTKADLSQASKEGKTDESVLNLMYGKMRGIVVKSKDEKVAVKSPSAVMGVRGTDFMMEYAVQTDKTEVSVLRGEVTLEKKVPIKKDEIKEQINEKAPEKPTEPIIIKSGYTASVVEKPIIKTEAPVVVPKEPQKISLEKLDEVKVISMVVDKKEQDKPTGEIKAKEELKDFEKEALKVQAKVEEEVKKDIIKEMPKDKKEEKSKEVTPGVIDINASLDTLLVNKLKEEGIDAGAYNKVPVEARVKARQAGMENKDITPRNIREKSKSNPEIKSIFDSVIENF